MTDRLEENEPHSVTNPLEASVNLENVSREDWTVGGLALLLAISFSILPWFDLSVTVGAFSASATYAAAGAPDGWLGILAFIACLALVADLALERFSRRRRSRRSAGAARRRGSSCAAIAAAFVVLKFLFHIHFSLFGWGFYVDVIITAALVYFAMQVRGGVARSSRGRRAPGRGAPRCAASEALGARRHGRPPRPIRPPPAVAPPVPPPEGPGGSTPPPRLTHRRIVAAPWI